MSNITPVYFTDSRGVSTKHIYASLSDEMTCLNFFSEHAPYVPTELFRIMRESFLKSGINDPGAIVLVEEFKRGEGISRKRVSIIIGDNQLAVTVNAGEMMKCRPFIPYTKPIPTIRQLTHEFMIVHNDKITAQQRASILHYMLTDLQPMWWIEPWEVMDSHIDLTPDPSVGVTCISWKNKDTQIFFSLTRPQGAN